MKHIPLRKKRKKRIAKKFVKQQIMNILHAQDVQTNDKGVSLQVIKQLLPDMDIKVRITYNNNCCYKFTLIMFPVQNDNVMTIIRSDIKFKTMLIMKHAKLAS